MGGYIRSNKIKPTAIVRFYLFEQVILYVYIINGVAPFKTPLLLYIIYNLLIWDKTARLTQPLKRRY